MKLLNVSRNSEVANNVRIADTFYRRAKGLLGERGLDEGNTLWIHRCNSIHTWFMRFPIDAVFVDSQMVVRAVYRNLGPWRMTFPAWKASSVFELPAGALDKTHVEIGDQLYVGD